MKVLILLLFAQFLPFKGICQDKDTLIYNSKRKLTWDDFQGKPKFSDRFKGAEITVTINLKVKKVSFWTGKPTYDAYAIAYKDNSWVKAAYKDDYTLAHEQLHFDIAHIYAETMEIEMNNLKKDSGQKVEVESILRKYMQLMRDYQALYDRETRGGNDIAKQKEWANKIKEDIKVIN